MKSFWMLITVGMLTGLAAQAHETCLHKLNICTMNASDNFSACIKKERPPFKACIDKQDQETDACIAAYTACTKQRPRP